MKKQYFFLIFGVTVSVLAFVTILFIDSDRNSNNISLKNQMIESDFDSIGYLVSHDDLLNRRTSAWISLLPEKISERTCFSLGENLMVQKNFFQSNLYLDPELHIWTNETQNRFSDYTESIKITNSEALEILSEYQFKMEEEPTKSNPLNLEDRYYFFKCFFEYNENQYELEIEFDPIFPNSAELVFVNIFNGENDRPILSQSDLHLIRGNFNNTVVFQNQLDQDIRLIIDGPDQKKSPLTNTTYDFLIPEGKVLSFYFNNIMSGGVPLNYTYQIEPHGLGGSVSAVTPNFSCLSKDEVEDLYNLGLNNIALPEYLPKNYQFKCGQEIINFAVKLFYWNDELGEFDKLQDVQRSELFLSKGGLIIIYQNELMNNFYSEEPYDKFSKATESCRLENCEILEINNNYGVFPKNSSKLTLFTDDNSYRIEIPTQNKEELVKIASSIEAN